MLADMAVEVEAMRLLTYKAGWLIDQGATAPILSAYAKAFGADHAMKITTDAVQIFGGYGYMKEYPVEKLMREAPPDLRGHEPDPTSRDSAESPEGLIRISELTIPPPRG
jgi:alkylation response protein AidB-like acyl-CoA dehydrogenase